MHLSNTRATCSVHVISPNVAVMIIVKSCFNGSCSGGRPTVEWIAQSAGPVGYQGLFLRLVDIKNAWSYTSILPWCLMKHRDSSPFADNQPVNAVRENMLNTQTLSMGRM
jgi:hypothetical protein